LRRYERRWLVERFFAGFSGNVRSAVDGNITLKILSALFSQQPLEYYPGNFNGMVAPSLDDIKVPQ
jgi:hypothetical protein